MTRHAIERKLRLEAAELGEGEIELVVRRAEMAAKLCWGGVSIAALLFSLDRHVACGASNGNTVVAICRGGEVVTIMLRRTNQPLTPLALRVDKILTFLKGNK